MCSVQKDCRWAFLTQSFLTAGCSEGYVAKKLGPSRLGLASSSNKKALEPIARGQRVRLPGDFLRVEVCVVRTLSLSFLPNNRAARVRPSNRPPDTAKHATTATRPPAPPNTTTRQQACDQQAFLPLPSRTETHGFLPIDSTRRCGPIEWRWCTRALKSKSPRGVEHVSSSMYVVLPLHVHRYSIVHVRGAASLGG